MSQNRYYSSTASKTTLAGAINNSVTSIVVAALTGYPVSLPWTGVIDRDTVNEEVVTVTGVSGTTLTVTRGADGTSGISHANGATFEHGVSARDFTEPQAHIAASTGVHGVAGAVVGTTDSQTLTNKVLTTPTIGDFTNAGHTHHDAAHGGQLAQADTHQSPDTDSAPSSLHHTLGAGANQAAAGNHAHAANYANFTPTWAGLTPGNSTVVARYRQVDKQVHVWGSIVFGSTATKSSTFGFELPVAPHASIILTQALGSMSLKNAASADKLGQVILNTVLGSDYVSFEYGDQVSLNNLTPGTWATGDKITFSFVYEAA